MKDLMRDECGSQKRTASDWLSFAAAPVFAIMALATSGGGMPGMAPLNGMAAMYVLMSVFHAAPWLALLRGRSNSTHNLIQRSEEQ
ncbi:MAG: hypothetical protein V4527_11635 [Pseudomonadota bacterium]